MVLGLLLAGLPVHAADKLSFEVASVKAAAPPAPGDRRGPDGLWCAGGPGTSDPGAWSCTHVTLAELIFHAYDLELYQFKPPDWMQTAWFAIAARVPAGTTREQFRLMQQNLLEERFKLVFHRQPKAMTVFELQVDKKGLKMPESAADAPAAEVSWSRVPGVSIGQDHYPVFPSGKYGLMGVNGYVRWRSSNVTLADIVRILRREMSSDVADGTGLTGKYDVDIYWQVRPIENIPSARPFDGPVIEKAIQDRLGLRLESKKGTVGVVVIDHIEKTPLEN
jgi:uncharacterized protein (TIGR03435 family)